MDDLISRQEAITAIQEAYADTEGGADKCAVWKNVGLTNALHIMQDLPSAQPYTEADIQKMQDLEQAEIQKAFELGKLDAESRWIPCSERLPETSGTYLVSGVWESGRVAVGDCEYSSYDGYFNTAWNFDVLAWMPLPEPYRGEGENG